MKRTTKGARRMGVIVGAVLTVTLLGACVSERGEVSQVELDERGADAVAPVFPDGEVPDDLVVEGVAHDLMSRPHDLHYWAPPAADANCAAELIVASVGAQRLVGLGYLPAVEGASLNDVELTADEVAAVAEAFTECVDLSDAVSSIVYGNGRLSASASRCFAERLADTGHLGGLALGWIGATRDDPFAADDGLAESIMAATTICVAAGAFNWPALHLPGGPGVIDVTELPPPATTEGRDPADDRDAGTDTTANTDADG